MGGQPSCDEIMSNNMDVVRRFSRPFFALYSVSTREPENIQNPLRWLPVDVPTRRELLYSAGGSLIGGAGVYTGMSLLATGYGSIEWSNERDEEVWVDTTLVTSGGLFSSQTVAYERRYRVSPTRHSRSGDTNVVETGTYDVAVEVESASGSESAGPFTTTWTPADCYHQRLIVRVLEDMSVKFLQKEC